MNRESRLPWLEPPRGRWPIPRIMRWRGRPRRIGCLLIVLAIAALCFLGGLLGRAINGATALFSDHPAVVAGGPFGTTAPARRASSGSPTIDRVVSRGRLIVAIQETPGLAARSPESGGYTGFDVALLGLIARDLGVDPARTSFKPLAASNREAALGRAEVDLVLGGYEITPARGAQVGIAGPYLVRPLRLAVPVSSPVTGLSSLGHATVCAAEDSPAAAVLTDRGLEPLMRATLGACANLLGGHVQAIAGDQADVTALLSQAPGTLRLVGEPLGTTEYGIGLPPGDPLLRERVTAVLRRAIDDGTWARFYAEYLGTPVPSPPVLR
ncbi:MAG: transporter substrate-binding domain-containing protein [Pseudonocardiaceae bacterium]